MAPGFYFYNTKYQETIRTLLAHLEPSVDGLGNGSPAFKILRFLLGKVLSVWILLQDIYSYLLESCFKKHANLRCLSWEWLFPWLSSSHNRDPEGGRERKAAFPIILGLLSFHLCVRTFRCVKSWKIDTSSESHSRVHTG